MLLLSDDLGQLSDARVSIATKIAPLTGVTSVTLDLHETIDSGIPSLLRLWCCDSLLPDEKTSQDSVALAAKNATRKAFSPDRPWDNPKSRVRSCIPVADGLGCWSVVSISNWLDESSTTPIPISALLPPSTAMDKKDVIDNSLLSHDTSDLGYHIFSFWSSKYIWVSSENFDSQAALSKRLGSHESEIFHVKCVADKLPEYIGSDIHFSCGYEVASFKGTRDYVEVQLKTENKRDGFIFIFLPAAPVVPKVKMNGISVES